MTDPSQDENTSNQSHRFRLSATPPSSIYTFSHVFPITTAQSEFFTHTTLPLVQDLLDGQNGLLFAYGVTNSGKTYTVQGGNTPGSAGILPRTLDVIFNSIDGLHADHRYRPVRLQGIEDADYDMKPTTPRSTPTPPSEPALADVLAEYLEEPAEIDVDPTALKLDRNYEYSVWMSYAEVYNEKAYDLLHTVNCDESSTGNKTIRPSFIPALSSANTNSLLLTRKALPVKPAPAADSGDASSAGKYIAGLRQLRVNSAAEAKALLKLGQLHRRVFGTLANSQSSRSHGVVTIKILRNHRGERNDPTAYQTSRLTLVDLAGSERTKHTHTTGDRLKEAGNINKSLMVLGQCMEVTRANQKRIAQSLQGNGRSDTRDVKRALAVVPFRHSKLTEILMDYFIGEGRAVMIVNVNPYDTGYDENSHVMKFAAVAREVCTKPVPAPLHRAPSPTKRSQTPSQSRPGLLGVGFAPNRRKVTLSSVGADRKVSQTQLEIVEEDEEIGEPGEDDEDEPLDPMVDALFEEIEILRLQLAESQLRSAMIEVETREEVMKEMDERMKNMEAMFSRRLMNEIARNEMKTDAKIDMLHRAGAFNVSRPVKQEESGGETSEMEDVETSLRIDEDESQSSGASLSESDTSATSSRRRKAGGQRKQSIVIVEHVPDGPECLPLLSEDEDAVTDDMTEPGDDEEQISEEDEEEDDEDTDSNEDDDDDWVPDIDKEHKPRKSASSSSSKSTTTAGKASSSKKTLTKEDFDSSSEDEISMLPRSPKKAVGKGGYTPKPRARSKVILSSDEEDMTMPTPRPAKKSTGLEGKMKDISLSDNSDEDVDDGASEIGKKKKRLLNKKAVLTEDQIARMSSAVEHQTVAAKPVRRVTRGTR